MKFWERLRMVGLNPKQSASCPMCAVLLEQLREARLREARLCRQLERKDEQIGQVITSKFETFNVSGPKPESDLMGGLPIETLQGVATYEDSDKFIEEAEKVLYPEPTIKQ